MEHHPRLNPSNLLLTEKKIILGSFPIWTLTNTEDETLNEEKQIEKLRVGDFDFFYGSLRNKFWSWYKEFIDHQIVVNDVGSIQSSLKRNNIGITDVIISCHRYKRSALDKHLSKRVYNYDFFRIPSPGEKLKILCTSKGLMNDMLLTTKFFSMKSDLTINEVLSNKFQNDLLNSFYGSTSSIKAPFYRLINCNEGGIIECFSIPSPGSPYRKLSSFGLKSGPNDAYLRKYLDKAFNWFME